MRYDACGGKHTIELAMTTLRTVAATIGLAAIVVAASAAAQPSTVPEPSVPDTADADSASPDSAAKGLEILNANCGRCHATGEDDASKHAEAPPFRVVVTRYPPENLAEALAEGIVSGHPDMPEFVFQPAEIEAILAYLGTLAPAPPASD
jgi:mono/diheme cytochrome c family protein